MATQTAHIIGGSLGGLMVGLLLMRQGWRVEIHERSPSPLAGRGAGIVSHPALIEALRMAGISIDEHSLGIEVKERRVFDGAGNVLARLPFPQLVTSWDRLFQILRGAFPDEHYHLGRALTGFSQNERAVHLTFASGEALEGDVLIGADGFRSTVRSGLISDSEPLYAGYVAWRGLIDEAQMSPGTHRDLFDSFAFCLPEGEQMLGYPVSGADNDLRCGYRRYNFVWYRPASKSEQLPDLLTDSSGRRHELSIPPPLIRPELVAAMRAEARSTLSPQFLDVVLGVEMPFFQPIYDFAAPQIAFGRVALMGDAAFVARPHVGAGVAKSGADAMALARALAADGPMSSRLLAYQAERLPLGHRIVAQARQLGAYMQSQQLSDEERAHAAANRSVEAIIEKTASLAFLNEAVR
jgi:2-polyprenyl-6-methoxyphenol hydroxylase-like FAD-dependent oxidoreductase